MNTYTPNKIKEFTDLKSWQEGHKLVVLIYKEINNFPKKETFSLTDQMRRSASSITSNIAEGFGRQTYKEKVQFYYQAQGSLVELKNQLLISKDVGYLDNKTYSLLKDQSDITHRLLQGLIKKSKSFVISKS